MRCTVGWSNNANAQWVSLFLLYLGNPNIGHRIVRAINAIEQNLQSGPQVGTKRVNDFVYRYDRVEVVYTFDAPHLRIEIESIAWV